MNQEYIIEFIPEKQKKHLAKYNMFWAVYCIFYGIFWFSKFGKESEIDAISIILTLFYFIAGILIFIYAFWFRRHKDEYKIVLNQKEITYRKSIQENFKIETDNISNIDINRSKIVLTQIDGSEHEFNFGDFPYKTVLELKDKIQDFAENNNITINQRV